MVSGKTMELKARRISAKMIIISIVMLWTAFATAGIDEDLLKAATCGDLHTVKLLLAKGASVNATDEYGWSALIYASKEGHLDVVRELLAQGADINAKKRYGVTALICASRNGHLSIVRELLAQGADVNAKDAYDGSTALTHAVRKNQREIENVLRRAGAKK